MLRADVKSSGQPTGSGGNQFERRIPAETPIAPHLCDPGQRLDRPQQHCRTRSLLLADEVGAEMDPVGTIHVESARGAEHAAVAGRQSSVGVGSGVVSLAQVGLHLDDSPRQHLAAGPSPQQDQTHEVGRDLEARALEIISSDVRTEFHSGDRTSTDRARTGLEVARASADGGESPLAQ